MNSKVTRTIINILLIGIAVCLGYFCLIKSIVSPINFDDEKTGIDTVVVQHLKDIRDAEIHYKQVHNKYTSSFDTLIDFCINYEIPIVRMVPDPNDTTFSKTINDTIGFIPVHDSLFGGREDFDINQLSIVPFSEPAREFEIKDSIIKRGGISVPVFEVKVPFEVYLLKKNPKEKGELSNADNVFNIRVMNEKTKLNQLDKYAGLKVGSLEETSTDGNWEKL